MRRSIFVFFLSTVDGQAVRGGSNCVLIEKGSVPRYYSCVGCKIDVATGCIDNMRNNISQNVATGCDIGALTERYESAHCCPRIGKDGNGMPDMMFVGSAYPEALRCLSLAGCGAGTIYNQLLEECYSVCPAKKYLDQYGTGPACLAWFNAAAHSYSTVQLVWLLVGVSTTCIMLLLF